MPADPLFELLRPARLTAVVDIGANPIDGHAAYSPLLDRGLCTVIGFDPQRGVLDGLLGRGPGRTYLPYAVGDGTTQVLHNCQWSGMTSFLTPDARSLALFPPFPGTAHVVSTEPVRTRPLDAIAEVAYVDMLHADVQGGELSVFRSGRAKLGAAVAVQTEVAFMPLYEHQPPLGAVDLELRALGFVPHGFTHMKTWAVAPIPVDGGPPPPHNQVLDGDLVYFRDLRDPAAMSDEQLKHLALIAHHCYRSHDVALYCVQALAGRGAVAADAPASFLAAVRGG